MKTANLTLHAQAPSIVSALAERGYALDPKPRGLEVDTDETMQDIVSRARIQVATLKEQGYTCLLIGGLSSAMIALSFQAMKRGMKVIEVSTFRTRDDEGKFVFNFQGVRVIMDVDHGKNYADRVRNQFAFDSGFAPDSAVACAVRDAVLRPL